MYTTLMIRNATAITTKSHCMETLAEHNTAANFQYKPVGRISCDDGINDENIKPICTESAGNYNSIKISIVASELGRRCSAGDNEDSLVLQLSYDDKKVLFVGDLEGEAVNELMKCDAIIESNALRLAHHGSARNNANNKDFLDKVNFNVAFSSSDPGHKGLRHSHCEILDWFVESFFTDNQITHRYICNGKKYHRKLKYPLYQTTVTRGHGGPVLHYIFEIVVTDGEEDVDYYAVPCIQERRINYCKFVGTRLLTM